MEETIRYEALLSAGEWSSLDFYEGDEPEVSDVSPDGETVEGSHACTIYGPPGDLTGTEPSFEIECGRCGTIGNAATEAQAQTISRLHEAFVATLVERWRVER